MQQFRRHPNLVTINVEYEAEKKTYLVPRGLLEFHSSYFAAALDPTNLESFATTGTRNLVLAEDIGVFDAFCCWLYTGRLKDPHQKTDAANPEKLYLCQTTLCKIWVFADMRGVPGLKNAAIDMLHEHSCAVWGFLMSTVRYTYSNTAKGALLRKYLVDAYTLAHSYNCIQELMIEEEMPADFSLEMMPILVRQGEDHESIGHHAWLAMDRCQWHDHSGPGGKLRLESRN